MTGERAINDASSAGRKLMTLFYRELTLLPAAARALVADVPRSHESPAPQEDTVGGK